MNEDLWDDLEDLEDLYEDQVPEDQRYATQGGGIVVWDRMQLCYRFVERSKAFPEMEFMPDQWGVIPINHIPPELKNL